MRPPNDPESTMSDLLLEWLQGERPILADGAMGTMLHAHGFGFELCFDELNLTHPEEIETIHRQYIQAGARMIETNTFGANRYKLAEHGLEASVDQLNQAAVQIARRAAAGADEPVLVAGSMGPLGVRLAPFGRVRVEDARAAYREQAQSLIAAGVDLIMVETQSDLYEIRAAVGAVRELSDLPIVATMTFTRDDRTLLGDTARRVARELADSGADVIGANCSGGPAQLLRIVQQMRSAAPTTPLCVMPNAGWPERVADRIMYPANPDYFAEYTRAFARAGASIIGGCCGTTPAHTARMEQVLRDPIPRDDAIEAAELNGASFTPAEAPYQPTQLDQGFQRGQFVLSVEMDPPRGFSAHKVLAGAHLLAEAGADVINVADSPMARMRMSPWAVSQLIQNQVGIETVLHFPTRGRNLLRVQGDLLAAHAMGVRNVFVVMGDPTAVGDYPEAMDNYDLVPTGLIKLIKHGFNTGVDHSGADIGGATSFFVGCALNLGAQDLDREVRLLQKKIGSGADFALTQPLYEVDRAARFMDRYRELYGALDLPILVGILPLFNDRHAAFLHNEVPGINVPDHIQARMRRAGDNSRQMGIEIAVDLLHSLRDLCQGAYLMPPFGRYDIAAEIIETVRAPARA